MTTRTNNGAKWLMLGALAASLATAQQTAPKISKEAFSSSESKSFKSDVFPTPQCNTRVEATGLQTEMRRNPIPTFDGVSPWPGLLGVWVHQKVGIYLIIANDRSVKFPSSKNPKIAVSVYDLCSKTRIGTGSASLLADQPTIRVKLENHSLTDASRPYLTLTRIEDQKSQKPVEGIMGMTLEYRKNRAERGSELKKESILLRNVLNL